MPTDGEGVSVLPALKFAGGGSSEPPRHLHQQRRRRSSAALDEPPAAAAAAAAAEEPPLPAALSQVKALNIEGIECLHRGDALGASAALDAAWAALEAHVARPCPPAGDEPAAAAAAVRSLQAATLSNRGCVLKRQGRVAEALAAMAEAIALEGVEGPSPSTLTNYAACLTAAGRYKEAVAACRRAVQGMNAQQAGGRRGEADAAGARHLLVATYHNLAHAQMCVPAEVQFAEGSFAQAYRLAVTFLGPTHPTTLAVAEHRGDAGRGHAHRHKHHRRHHAAPPHAPRQPRPPAQQARRRSTRTTSVVQEAAAAAAAALASSSASSLPDIAATRNHVAAAAAAAAAPQQPPPPLQQPQHPQAPQRDLGGASFRQGGRPMTKKDAAQLQEAKERARRERAAHPRRTDLRPLGGGKGKKKAAAAAAAATAEADTQTPPAGPLIMLDHRGSPLCAPEVVASPGFFSSYAAEEAAAAATAVAAPLSPQRPLPPPVAAASAPAAAGEEEVEEEVEEEGEEEAPYAAPAEEEAKEEAEEAAVEEEEAAALCPQPPSRDEEASLGELRRGVDSYSRLDDEPVREEQVVPAPAPAGSGTLHIPSGVEAAAARVAAEATQVEPSLAPRPPLPAAATTAVDGAHPQASLEVVPAESPAAAAAANVVPRRVETQPRTLAEIRAELAGERGCGGGGLAPRKAYSEPSAPHSRASAVGTPTPRCASQASSAAFESSAAAAAFGGGVSRRFAAKRQRRLRQMERDAEEEAALQREGERVQRAASLRAEALERAAERRRARQAVCAAAIQRAYRRHLRRRLQRQQRERRTPPPPPPDGVLAIAATPEAIACGFLDTLLRFKTRAELEVFTRHVVGIQRAWRAVAARLLIAARKAAAGRQWAAAVEAERLHHAAAVLQAIARGICGRRRVRELRWSAVEKWALTIYAWWLTRRVWVDGRWVSRRCHEGARATEVQRVWRGFAGRRRAADVRLRRRMDAVAAPVEWTAAVTLQGAVRACLSARVAAVLGCKAAVREVEGRRRTRVRVEELRARGVLEGLRAAGEAQAREDMRINAKLPQARAFAERCRAERLACIEKQWEQRVEEMYTPGPSVQERQRAWVLDTERVERFVRAAGLVLATLRVQRFLRVCLKETSPGKRVLNERFRQAVRDRRSKRHDEVKVCGV